MTARRGFGVIWAGALLCLAPLATSASALPRSPHGGLKQTQLQAPGIATNDLYGVDVAVSGQTVVVGSPNQGSGVVYVFTRPSNGWHGGVSPVKLTPPSSSAAGAEFGHSVAIQGSTIVVGASQQTVGSNEGQGATYVFAEPHGGWHTTSHPTATLTAKGGRAFDALGGSVALSGSTIVAAAYGRTIKGDALEGAAYVFTKSGTRWRSEQQAATLTDSSGGIDDGFGSGVAVTGNSIVIGIFAHPGAGVAAVFAEPKHGWHSMTQTRTLRGDDTAPVDEFGFSVAAVGRTVVVGAPDHEISGNANEGAAYVFTEPAHGWGPRRSKVVHQVAELASDHGATNDSLGDSVSLSGRTIVLGAGGHLVDGNSGQGAVYGFREPSRGWTDATQSFELSAKVGTADDGFGTSVAIAGGVVAIGAPDTASSAGAAYVFATPGPVLSHVKQSHASWSLGAHQPVTNPKHKPSGGTEFSFSLSEAATVSLSFSERADGKYRHVHTIVVHAKSGRTREYVDGALDGGESLTPGHCRVNISASNTGGTARPTTLRFTIR